jgi:signal transduction histidine kinase/DNA-binding LacI/PurR family transcriptional regulator
VTLNGQQQTGQTEAPRPTIGMLTSSVVDLYELQWLGTADAAAAHGADFICFVGEELDHPDGFRAQANAVYDLVSAQRLDGLIVWTTALEVFAGRERMVEFCRRFERLPIVSVERVLEGSPSVLMEERHGMEQAVSHLIEAHGCERIAFIRGPEHHTGAEDRFGGYLDALERHGLPFDPDLTPMVHAWAAEQAHDIATALLSSGGDRIDAIAAANDDLALGVVSALEPLGLRAPQDVAVIGFDDHINVIHHGIGMEIMRADASGAAGERVVNLTALSVPLTTVRAPFYRLGWQAVELLLAQLRGNPVPDVVTIPTELVIRRSCGCFSSSVREAALDRGGGRSHETSEDVATELERTLARSHTALPPHWQERLEAAFAKDVEGESEDAFLDVLDELARTSIRAGDTVGSWWRALSVLRRHTATRYAAADVEHFWLRAQTLLAELAESLSQYEHLVAARRERLVRRVGRRLLAAAAAAEIAAVLADDLPKLGIPSCYLAMYTADESDHDTLDTSRRWSRALLVQEDGRRIAPAVHVFPSKRLAPVERLGRASPASLLAMPLYFKEQQLGFVLLERGPRIGWVYPELREQLSTALHAALLVESERRALAAVELAHEGLEEHVAMRTAELAAANEALARANEGLTEQIIERERAEEKQARLEAQLLQAQKMEAIGRLAGGIAHDFNNMLVVINGFSDLLLARAVDDDPIREDLAQIRQAGERAADLTRRLLAFSRQQVIRPSVLNLNDVISSLQPMLRRLIGEDLDLVTKLAPQLSPVRADPGQIEQTILNLALNARDAMGNGGCLTIATANVELGEDYAREHVGVETGPRVLLRVSDTGVGMDAATQARMFEPFFTTKPAGRGTGLGLATVFGIVQQAGGHIDVSSTPGQGSRFDIYLPPTLQPAEETAEAESAPSSFDGTETILLVEDEPGVRRASRRFLEEHGYRVLDASDAGEALRLAELHEGEVDLVITDLVMPGMSGRELADRVAQIRPETPILYVSGYTDGEPVRSGLRDGKIPLLQKPFGADVLARKVRETLDSRN